jgi:hypothetical protein
MILVGANELPDVGWNVEMERYLGAEATVTEADEERGSVHVNIDNGLWYWLMDWLDPIGPGPG